MTVYARLREAQDNALATASVVEQATRAYEIAELRFREGLSTQTELQDVRLQLEQSRANQAQAARDLQVARLRLTLLPYLPLGTADGIAADDVDGHDDRHRDTDAVGRHLVAGTLIHHVTNRMQGRAR